MTTPGLSNQAIPSGSVNVVSPLPVTGVGGDPVLTEFADSHDLDAFGRLRVSGQGIRIDSTFTYDKQPQLFDEIVGGAGSATHDANLRAVYLSTGGVAAPDAAALRLHFHTPYTPGNSQLIVITGNLNPDNVADFTNARTEIGYGNPQNGVGFRMDANGVSVFLRSSISGVPVDLVTVQQAAWNKNLAPGVDWTKSQIFMIDFQSLAVGRIRFLLDRAGQAILLHEIYNDNLRVGPFWQNASLPPYWTAENTGVANAVVRCLAICCTVKSEGAPNLNELSGFPFSGSNVATPKTISTSLIPVLSIQVKTLFGGVINRGLAIIQDVALMGTNPFFWRAVLNTTLTGPAFASVDANSLMNLDTTASALLGGRNILAGYSGSAGGGSRVASNIPLTGKIPLSVNAPGTVGDILTIAAIRIGTQDSAVSCAINWQEIR